MKSSIALILLFLGISLSQSIFAQDDPVHLTIYVHEADSIIKVYADSSNFAIIDVRTPGEFDSGYIDGAENLDSRASDFDTDLELLDRSKIYLIYCAGGGRSGVAFNKMKTLEFENVYNMKGGINAWINAGYPVVKGTGIEEIISESNIIIYPNPAGNHFIIKISNKEQLKSFAIFDLQGRLITTEMDCTSEQIIDCSSWPSGLYILKTTSISGDGLVYGGLVKIICTMNPIVC